MHCSYNNSLCIVIVVHYSLCTKNLSSSGFVIAFQPVKAAGAAKAAGADLIGEDGHGTQGEAIEQAKAAKQKRASEKRRLQDKEMGDIGITKLHSWQQTRVLQGSTWKGSSQIQYMTEFDWSVSAH